MQLVAEDDGEEEDEPAGVQADAPSPEVAPAWHAKQEPLPSTENVFRGQSWHVEASDTLE